jgi:hypothetical protein
MKTIAIFILILLMTYSISDADWPVGGVQISDYMGMYEQWVSAPDGSGGAWVVYVSYDWDIWVQHIDNEGNLLYPFPGFEAIDDPSYQGEPQVCSDGNGGIVFAFQDYRNGVRPDIYAHKIDRNGNEVWPHNGVSVFVDPDHEMWNFDLKTNSNGKTIIAWQAERELTEILAQCLDADGNKAWGDSALAIGSRSGWQSNLRVVMDSSYSFYITWEDGRPDSLDGGIYAQKIDTEGNTYWGDEGIRACYRRSSEISRIYSTDIDGHGGIFICWSGYLYDIYAVWVDSAGISRWDLDGIRISILGNGGPRVKYDGLNGALVSWNCNEDGQMVQWIKAGDPENAIQWEEEGKLITTGVWGGPASIIDAGNGEWIMNVSNRGLGFSQKFDTTGVTYWGDTGVRVWDVIGEYNGQTDGEGGVIAMGIIGNSRVWAQRIYHDGSYSGQTSIEDDPVELTPQSFILYDPYPNPFNSSTTIRFDLPVESEVNLTIYNLMGQEMATLIDSRAEAGRHSVNWDAADFASGFYFYRLTTGHDSVTKKMVLLK